MLAQAEAVVSKGFVRGPPSWPERVVLYRRIASEQSNFRAALAFCLAAADAERGLRLCSALRSPWVVHGDVTEGIAWFDRFLTLNVAAPAAVRVRALMLGAELAFEHQDYLGAARWAQAAVNACTALHAASPAGGLRMLALISLRAGLPAVALERADEAIAAARQHGDDWEEGLALVARAMVLARGGDLAAAQACYEEALDVLADNNGWGVAHALYGFGTLARSRNDNAAALRHFRSALELFRAIDARTEIARCQAGIGWIALGENDLATAAVSFAESLELSVATGQRLGIARGLEAVAALAAAKGDAVTAIRLEGAATATRQVLGPNRPATAQARLDSMLAAAHLQLGEEVAASLTAEGSRLSTHEAARFALITAGNAGDGARAGLYPGEKSRAESQLNGPRRVIPDNAERRSALLGPALTAREQEIALLIARGLSNRAIADELVISPATAARHVANILSKLGLNSRAQVAAWTVDQGPDFGRKR
jgi:DNA-binding CsgD family transcriptional regulator/Tfp pilus assembly protein PilF